MGRAIVCRFRKYLCFFVGFLGSLGCLLVSPGENSDSVPVLWPEPGGEADHELLEGEKAEPSCRQSLSVVPG